MTPRCHLCGQPILGPWATITFGGFDKLALDGVTFTVDAACLQFTPDDRGIILPDRAGWVEEQAAQLVTVTEEDPGEFTAFCRDCDRTVAIKDNSEDAHLGAARHLANVHLREAVLA